ncbi:MAG: hypothetical protein IT453_08765 [Planctomycetes bacterium]|nr:hypothetical protein [Planctomycetota bacterium]
MKLELRLLSLVAALQLAPVASADELVWAPPAKSERKKTLEVHHYLDITKVQKALGDMAPIDDPVSGQIATWERLIWIDRVDAVEGSRVDRFVRKYHELASGGTADLVMPGPAGKPRTVKQSDTCASTMAQREVRFTWVPAEQGYGRLWERLEGPEDFLQHIDHDVDLASALPGKDVNEGDSWSIAPERAVAFLAPGGYRFFEPRQATQFARTHKVGAGGELAAMLDTPQGKITATYKGRRTVDDRACGVIAIELDVTATSDRAEAFESIVPPEEARDPRRLSSCVVESHFKASGEVLWDLEAKRFHRFELKGTESMAMALAKRTVNDADEASVLKQTSTLEGSFQLQLVNAEPDPVAPPKDAVPGSKPAAGEKKP